jgi:MHS family alpha-ketoglutarate permease-like MFS transporter
VTGAGKRIAAIIGGSAGNLVEWYDWFAYTAFSIYFAPAFFPGGDQTSALMQTAAVFAVGFFARPLGAWGLGLVADHAGRRTALALSVGMMGVGSLIVALLPTHQAIGAAAPVVLVLTRLLQGLSIGGEYGASATYLSEMAGARRRGLLASFQPLSLIGGQLLALAVLIALQGLLTPPQLRAFGWRIPFAIGAALAFGLFFVQRRLAETPAFEAVRGKARERSVSLTLLREHPRECAMVMAFTAGGSLAFYVYTVYLQVFLTNSGHFSKAAASRISAAALVIFFLIQPLGGWLSDRVGRRPILAGGFLLTAALTWPVMTGLATTTSAWVAFALTLAALIALTGYSSVNALVKAELFPSEVRGLGVALPFALANAVFGGTAEFIALAFKKSGNESAFFVYASVILAIAGVTALRMRESRVAGLIG